MLALAGCQPSDRELAGDSVETFLHAYADGDAKTACARLVPEVRKAFEGGCEAGLKQESDALSKAEKDRLHALGVRDVRIKGDRANVWLEGQGGEPGTLRRVNGEWLIENRYEEGADVGREQLRRLGGGEVAAARHVHEVLDGVDPLRPLARQLALGGEVVVEVGDAGRHAHALVERRGAGLAVVEVVAQRAADRARDPVERHELEQEVTVEGRLEVTARVGPRAPLLEDPGRERGG